MKKTPPGKENQRQKKQSPVSGEGVAVDSTTMPGDETCSLQDAATDENIAVSDQKMTLIEHLEEMRIRILICVFAWGAGSVFGWYAANPVISYFKSFPTLRDVQLILIRPPEAFFVRMKLSLIAGFLIALPIIIYEILSFVIPGLTIKEKKWALRLIPCSVLLFYGGAAFSIFILLPVTLRFFLVYMTQGIATPQISLEEYVNFLLTLVIAGGAIFQTPVAIFLLTIIGILSSEKLRQGRKVAILIIFIIAAIITPTPDPFTQTITAIPMIVLYELSIGLAKLAGK